MRKRRKSDDVLNRKRQKRSLKEARRKDFRKRRILERAAAEREAREAMFEELKKRAIKDWEKGFND